MGSEGVKINHPAQVKCRCNFGHNIVNEMEMAIIARTDGHYLCTKAFTPGYIL